MENATKALIIAASVLIAIVLISVGVRILSSTNGVTTQTKETADVMQVESFNSQLTSYIGTSISGAQVKSFLSKVNAIRAKGHTITITGDSTDINNISANKTYTIKEISRDDKGYITNMSCNKN